MFACFTFTFLQETAPPAGQKDTRPSRFSGVTSRYSEQSNSRRRIQEIEGVDRSKFKFDRSPYVGQYCLIDGKDRNGDEVPVATAKVLAGQHDHVDFTRTVHASASAGLSIGKEFHESLMRRKNTSLQTSVPEVSCTHTHKAIKVHPL